MSNISNFIDKSDCAELAATGFTSVHGYPEHYIPEYLRRAIEKEGKVCVVRDGRKCFVKESEMGYDEVAI